MPLSYETTCTIAVPQDSVAEVSRLLGRAGFELVLGDLQEKGRSPWRLVRTTRTYDSAADSAEMSRVLAHEVAVRRVLLAAAAHFEIMDSGGGPVDPPHWWQVRFAATGTTTGMRVRASAPSGADEQLDALARFLGVPRSSLIASPEPELEHPPTEWPTGAG